MIIWTYIAFIFVFYIASVTNINKSKFRKKEVICNAAESSKSI